jgi:ATP adenylyltransferase
MGSHAAERPGEDSFRGSGLSGNGELFSPQNSTGGGTVERLWAPWRMTYVKGETADEGCVFCTKPPQDRDRENLILTRCSLCYVIMNLYPYNNGHLMVVPYQHVAGFETLGADASAQMWDLCRRSVAVLRKAFNPDGFNIGMNMGRAAGAGIDQHLHLHIVPRWNGDTNFMPVVGETKVISQALSETWGVLQPLYQACP